MGVFQQKASSKGSGGDFEKAPAGNHPARLVAIVDMGTQKQEYGDKQSWQRRAFFIWELVMEKMSGTKDRNHLIGVALTVSLNEKAKLRQWIEARVNKKMPEGADYDITKELGQPCLLSVVHNEKGYPKVEGMSAVPKGMACPAAQNRPFSWSLEDFEKEGEIELPDWIREQYLFGEPIVDHIMRSKEIQAVLTKSHQKTSQAKKDDEAVGAALTAPAEQQEDEVPF